MLPMWDLNAICSLVCYGDHQLGEFWPFEGNQDLDSFILMRIPRSCIFHVDTPGLVFQGFFTLKLKKSQKHFWRSRRISFHWQKICFPLLKQLLFLINCLPTCAGIHHCLTYLDHYHRYDHRNYTNTLPYIWLVMFIENIRQKSSLILSAPCPQNLSSY